MGSSLHTPIEFPDWFRNKASYRNRNQRACETKETAIGKQPRNRDVLLMSNDYLAISAHPWIVEEQIKALQVSQKDLLMSAAFLGEGTYARHVESKYASFVNKEDALLTQSGYCANVGLIQSIADAK